MNERIKILEDILKQSDQANYLKNTIYFEMVEKWKMELQELKLKRNIKEF